MLENTGFLKSKVFWIIIGIALAITSFNVYLLRTLDLATSDYRQQDVEKTKQLTQLQRQRELDKIGYEIQLQKVRETSIQTDIVFGYMIGYLSGMGDRRIIKDPELPELAVLIVQYSEEVGVNPYEFLTICQIENDFSLHDVGPDGEQGPAQVLFKTWQAYYRQLGYREKDFYNWRCTLRVGAHYYSDLRKEYSDSLELAVKHYNGSQEDMVRRYYNRFQIANRGISKLSIRREKT